MEVIHLVERPTQTQEERDNSVLSTRSLILERISYLPWDPASKSTWWLCMQIYEHVKSTDFHFELQDFLSSDMNKES